MNPSIGDQQSSVGAAKPNAVTWKHPAGHATWCAIAVPFVRQPGAGDTAMTKGCTCGKSAVARSLRKLARIQSSDSVPEEDA